MSPSRPPAFLAGFMLLAAFSGATIGMAKIVTTLYALHIGASPMQLGVISAMESLGMVLLTLPAGFVIARYGARRVYFLASLGPLLLNLAIPLAGSWLWLAAARLLIGLCIPFRIVAMNSAFLRQLRHIGNDKAGWYRGALTLGMGLLGPLLGNWLSGGSFTLGFVVIGLCFGLMALYAAIALVWRIKLCEILAMACAPSGAAFTLVTLATGSIWGKPMWGTWWDWDPRLTTELILLFLYLGVIGLYHAGDDRRASARAAGLLAIVGVALLPVIRYSVEWWDSLHQGQTIRVFGESSMDPSMVAPLWWMVAGTKFWFAGSLLSRARADNLRRESGKDWVRKLAEETA